MRSAMEDIRLGILGAGHIADQFASAVDGATGIKVVAIGSRDAERARAFAEKHSLPLSFGSYEALIESSEIDAVYVATPNGSHKALNIASAQAGKHVLCEKPMALSVQDAQEMFATAHKHGVVLIEGFLYRFQPQTLAALAMLREGRIGDILTVSGGFGFTLKDANNPRWDPDEGGGALWDVGVYPLSLARAVFGKAPLRITASARMAATGVDSHTNLLLEYGDGACAEIWCSFETPFYRRAQIVGTLGLIDFGFANHTSTADDAALWIHKNGALPERVDNAAASGFVLEAEAFARLIRGDRDSYVGISEEETIDNTATCEAALRSLNSGATEVVEI